MNHRSLRRTWAAALLLLAALCGCTGGGETPVPVKGKVTYKGAALQGGTIVFIPDTARGTHGRLATADIQPDGTFALKTDGVLGAVPGWHRVTVAWVLPGPGGQTPQSLLPVKYRDPQQSGLTWEVLANKPNTVELNLE
jgi:hypothetical protein